MSRPCFLVIDQEFPGSISTRKLVLETAKYNVLTAYSEEEAVELLERFPNVDGVVLNASSNSVQCSELVSRFRQICPKIRVILTSGRNDVDCGPVDLHLDSYDPRALMAAVAKMFPEESARLISHDDWLQREFKDGV